MNFIPIYLKPYPDELMYSWIHRLAAANDLTVPQFADAYLGMRNTRPGWMYLDTQREFSYLTMHICEDVDIKKLYLDTSVFAFYAPFMTKDRQTRYVNSVFQPKDLLNKYPHRLFKTARVCPECMNEDIGKYGEPYLHRAHHLEGVCVCHKHGTPLLMFHGIKGHECDFSDVEKNYAARDSEGTSRKSEMAYAKYAAALLNVRLNTDMKSLAEVIKFLADGDGLLECLREWEYSDLLPGFDPKAFFKLRTIKHNGAPPREMTALLMFIYPDPNELAKMFPGGSVIEEYICENCGEKYISTVNGHENGWGCPVCNMDISEQERFERLADTMSRGSLVPLTDFSSLSEHVLFRHRDCGGIVSLKPEDLLFHGSGCPCENKNAPVDPDETIGSLEGFTITSFCGTAKPVTIRHAGGCGREFTCDYYDFLKNPRCRACEPFRMTEDAFKDIICDLTGDEYELAGKYANRAEKVGIRHVCGHVTRMRPKDFMAGQRCEYCRQPITRLDLEELLNDYGRGRYELTGHTAYNCEIFDKKTGQTQTMPVRLAVQELKRPTKSRILPTADGYAAKGWKPYWDMMFGLLLQYQSETGDVNVPQRLKYKDALLGEWVTRQKIALRDGTLTEKQTRLLADAGITSDMRKKNGDDIWMAHLEQYDRALAAGGRVTRKTDFDGFHIGEWAHTQKKRVKNGTMPDWQRAMLHGVDPDVF